MQEKRNLDEMNRAIKDALLMGHADKVEADIEFDKLLTNSKNPAEGRVALYARHSCNAQSLEQQVAEVAAFAEKIGDTDFTVFKEIAGPYEEEYEQQETMLAKIKQGEYKRVYVKSRTRFSKDPIHSLKFAKDIVDMGVEIIEL